MRVGQPRGDAEEYNLTTKGTKKYKAAPGYNFYNEDRGEPLDERVCFVFPGGLCGLHFDLFSLDNMILNT